MSSVHSGNRLRVWLVTGCCLTLTFFFLAAFNGELGLLAQLPGDYSFDVQEEAASELRHDLLEDISNATLGVWMSPCHYVPLRTDTIPVPEDIRDRSSITY
jgi:hypothetical protein